MPGRRFRRGKLLAKLKSQILNDDILRIRRAEEVNQVHRREVVAATDPTGRHAVRVRRDAVTDMTTAKPDPTQPAAWKWKAGAFRRCLTLCETEKSAEKFIAQEFAASI